MTLATWGCQGGSVEIQGQLGAQGSVGDAEVSPALADMTISDGCEGDCSPDAGLGPSDSAMPADLVAVSGLRRLSVYEYDNTVRDLLDDGSRPGKSRLPEDFRQPFDNDQHAQFVSRPLIESVELLAREIAERLRDDPQRLARLIGCTPSSVTDRICMSDFVRRFGRRALRRSLTEAEIGEFLVLGVQWAQQRDNFDEGALAIIEALLQDPEFVYRVEIGEAVGDGLFRLSGPEIATRMSYLLWGSSPDAWLLDRAEAGALDTAEGRTAAAREMLTDWRAIGQVLRFHSLWLGYEDADLQLPWEMAQETEALIERVVFEDLRPWVDLFTLEETLLGQTMAAHYDLPEAMWPAPGRAQWFPAEAFEDALVVDTLATSRGVKRRAGILSHSTVLAVAANALDTSPTRRGQFVRERLMCQPIPPPPPDVESDNPPPRPQGSCRVDNYAAHTAQGRCATCHTLMDPIGFGLENFDRDGRFRAFDFAVPELGNVCDLDTPDGCNLNLDCPIQSEGVLVRAEADPLPFSGPAELGALLVSEGLVDSCMVQHLYQFALGRSLDFADAPMYDALTTHLREVDPRLDQLLVALIAHPAFVHRREE
ncbi:MAG: DUF1588 domain-containing protein [Bradymonadia bacterium]